MKPPTTRLDDNDKILRFLDEDGLLRTLGLEKGPIPRQITDMNPSFLLRSLRQYSSWKDHKGDRHENEIITLHPENRTPLSSKNLNPIFVSCWSYYQSTDLVMARHGMRFLAP